MQEIALPLSSIFKISLGSIPPEPLVMSHTQQFFNLGISGSGTLLSAVFETEILLPALPFCYQVSGSSLISVCTCCSLICPLVQLRFVPVQGFFLINTIFFEPVQVSNAEYTIL